MFIGDSVYSEDKAMRVTAQFDDFTIQFMELFDSAPDEVVVRPVALPRHTDDDYFTHSTDELVELWDELNRRLFDCSVFPQYPFKTVEDRADDEEIYTLGGLINSEEDALEVFTRLARMRGVEVVKSTLPGQSPSDMATVVAWTSDASESINLVHSVLEEANDIYSGNVYSLVLERKTMWTSDLGEERTTWEPTNERPCIVGFKYLEDEAKNFLNENIDV